MQKTLAVSFLAVGLVFGADAARACPCDATVLHTLGNGEPTDVGGGHLDHVVGMSIAAVDGVCYVMYAGTNPEAPADRADRWRLRVKKSTAAGWVFTNGGNAINVDENKTTWPYFYEFKLIVFQNRLYAIFAESDGDGITSDNGHKVIHAKRYDANADVWESIDGTRPAYARFGLDLPFITEGYSHWSYIGEHGVTASNDALYAAWTYYKDPGDAPIGKAVIRKYAKVANTESYAWTTLPTTGLPDVQPNGPTSNGIVAGSLSLGVYQGSLVLAYSTYAPRNRLPQIALRIAMYDETEQVWRSFARMFLNTVENTAAGAATLVEHNDELYVAWRETTYKAGDLNNPPYRLLVKKYTGINTLGQHIWDLVGTAAVRSSASISAPTLLSDEDGLTLVAWDTSDIYIDRFVGTTWSTVATSGTHDVIAPYAYYMYSPSVAAISYDGEVIVSWQAKDNTPGTLIKVSYSD